MRAVFAIALCACGFQSRLPPGAIDAAVDPEGIDAGDGNEMMIDGAPDMNPTANTECTPSVDLVACWAFNGNGNDGSNNGHGATLSAINMVTGKYGMAVDRTSGSDVQVANAAAFNLVAFTFELYVQADAAPPSGARIVLFDKDGQYGVVWQDDLDIECSFAHQGEDVATRAEGGNFAAGSTAWTHIACSYDGLNLRTYVNGTQVAITASTATVRTGTATLRLGEDHPSGNDTLDGRIDTVRLWRIAKAPTL